MLAPAIDILVQEQKCTRHGPVLGPSGGLKATAGRICKDWWPGMWKGVGGGFRGALVVSTRWTECGLVTQWCRAAS